MNEEHAVVLACPETSDVLSKPELKMAAAQRFAIPLKCFGFQCVKVHDIAIYKLALDQVCFVKDIKLRNNKARALQLNVALNLLLRGGCFYQTFVHLFLRGAHVTIAQCFPLFLLFTPVLGAHPSALPPGIFLEQLHLDCCLQSITPFCCFWAVKSFLNIM